MQVKELIKELQGMPQDKKVNILIPKKYGLDTEHDIYHDDISHVTEQEETVEIYCYELED
jgi:uncharacterized membrane protein YfhO